MQNDCPLAFYAIDRYRPESFAALLPQGISRHILVVKDWVEPQNFRDGPASDRKALYKELKGTLRIPTQDSSLVINPDSRICEAFEAAPAWVWFGAYSGRQKIATFCDGSQRFRVARELFRIAFGNSEFIKTRMIYEGRKDMMSIRNVEGFAMSDVNPFHHMPAGTGPDKGYVMEVEDWMHRHYLSGGTRATNSRCRQWMMKPEVKNACQNALQSAVDGGDIDYLVDSTLLLSKGAFPRAVITDIFKSMKGKNCEDPIEKLFDLI